MRVRLSFPLYLESHSSRLSTKWFVLVMYLADAQTQATGLALKLRYTNLLRV